MHVRVSQGPHPNQPMVHAGFPMGLMLCVVAGADLFTSNCMLSSVGGWEGETVWGVGGGGGGGDYL